MRPWAMTDTASDAVTLEVGGHFRPLRDVGVHEAIHDAVHELEKERP